MINKLAKPRSNQKKDFTDKQHVDNFSPVQPTGQKLRQIDASALSELLHMQEDIFNFKKQNILLQLRRVPLP